MKFRCKPPQTPAKPPQNPTNKTLKKGGVGDHSGTLPLLRINNALQKVWVFMFFDPGPGGSGSPREAPEGPPWAFPGPPGASRRLPGT